MKTCEEGHDYQFDGAGMYCRRCGHGHKPAYGEAHLSLERRSQIVLGPISLRPETANKSEALRLPPRPVGAWVIGEGEEIRIECAEKPNLLQRVWTTVFMGWRWETYK